MLISGAVGKVSNHVSSKSQSTNKVSKEASSVSKSKDSNTAGSAHSKQGRVKTTHNTPATTTAYNPVSPATTDQQHGATEQDIINAASRVNSAGDRFGPFDDYAERMDVFIVEVSQLSDVNPEDGARLVTEILHQDLNASSWMNFSSLQERQSDGFITSLEVDTAVNAMVGAYNDGNVEFSDIVAMTNFGDASTFYEGGQGRDLFLGTLESAGANPVFSGEVSAFRENFSLEIFDGNVPEGTSPDGRLPTAGERIIAVEMLSQNGNTAVADVLSRIPGDSLQRVLSAASGAGMQNIYAERAGYATTGDTLALITDSITASGNDALALEVVRFADEPYVGFFESGGVRSVPERAELLSELFINHSDYILDALTTGSQQVHTDGATTELGINLNDLSNFMRLTALNPDNTMQVQVIQELQDYTVPLVDSYNHYLMSDGHSAQAIELADDNMQRIVSIGAAAQDAYRSAHFDNQANIEAKRAMVSFVFDVGLAALPLPSMADDAISNRIANMISAENAQIESVIEDTLNAFSGQVIDSTSETLTDDARDALVEALSDDQELVLELYESADEFIQWAIVDASLTENDMGFRMNNTLEQIDSSR